MVSSWVRAALPSVLLVGALLAGCIGSDGLVADTDGPGVPEDLAGYATLTGRVLAPSLDPLLGANVVAVGVGGLVRHTTTAEDGSYELLRIEPGKYRIQVVAPCCQEHSILMELEADEVRTHNVLLEPLPAPEVPYTEIFSWDGFTACQVNAGNTGASCGATDPNDERLFRFEILPGLKHMVIAMDWTQSSMTWGEEMRLRVMHGNCNSNGGSCTYAHVRGPAPLEVTLDEKSGGAPIQFPNITEEQRITVRVWPNGTPNFVYQQPFTMYFHLYYHEAAPEGASALPP